MAQGLLLSANGVKVAIEDADSGLRRRLLKAMRWHRLLAALHQTRAAPCTWIFRGPDPFSTNVRVTACNWPASTPFGHRKNLEFKRPRHPTKGSGADRSTAQLLLNHNAPLQGHSHFLAHTPPEIANCHLAWGDKLLPWTVSDDPPLLPMTRGDLAVPDFQFIHSTASGRKPLYLECFHRWHRSSSNAASNSSNRRIAPQLLLAVDRALVRSGSGKELLEASPINNRVMLFNDLLPA